MAAPILAPSDLHQQVVEHYRDLRSSHLTVKTPVASKMLVKFMKKIKYDIVNRDQLLADAMRQVALKIMSHENKRIRKSQASKTIPVFGTKADKKDVAALKKAGIDIDLGADVHKDCFSCPIEQLEDMIRFDTKSITTPRRKVAYKTAAYKLRTGLQWDLPFDIPSDIMEDEMRKAEEDMKKLI